MWSELTSITSLHLDRTISMLVLVSLLSMPISMIGASDTRDEGMTGPGTTDLSSIYWPMIGRDPYHSSSGSRAPRGLADPIVGWNGNTTSLAAVGTDITNNVIFDGVPAAEVFGIIESNNTHIRIRDGDSGTVIWQVDVRLVEGRATNRLRMAPAVSDIDSDGKVEVLVYIWDLNQFQLGLFEPIINMNSTGYHWSRTAYFDERVWLSINVPSVPDPHSSPILYDISGDGVEDVLVGSGNSLASFFGNNGTVMWLFTVGQLGETLSTPAIYPGAGGVRRIVINSLSATRQSLRTTLVNFNGTHLMNTSVPLGSTVPYQYAGRITMPVIGDVTGTGQPEILISYPSRFGEGRITVYSYQLESLAEIDTITGLLESTPSVADADGDGDLEIFVHSRYYTTSSWINMSCYDIVPLGPDLTVNVRWWRDAVNVGTSPLYTSPLLCDLNGDDAPDSIFVANDWVHAVSFSGSMLWSLQLPFPQFGFQGLVGDLGRDEFTDLFFDGIMISQEVIDLTVKKPVSESIYPGEEPVNGVQIPLHCIIENLGTSTASGVKVLFEATPPGGEKEVVGTTVLEEVVNTFEATVQWTPTGVGNHRIDVTIDPNGTIIETNEANNAASAEISVREAIPDLVVHDVRFVRGDGLVLTGANANKKLVGGDPSTIMVQVGNIGEGPSYVGLLDIYINGSSPGPQGTDVPIGTVVVGKLTNITIAWTPPGIPEGGSDMTYNVTAEIDTDTQGMDELDKFNNKGYNISVVKSRTPVGGFEIGGRVRNSQGQGESEVRVTATNKRTQASLEDETNFQGDYSIYFPETDYLDGDTVELYARKATSWAQNATRLYSEDGSDVVGLLLTDIPTMAVDLIPDGQLEYEVLPRTEYNLRFWVENTGNIPGDASLERVVTGNSSMTTSQVLISPTQFSLAPSERREVSIHFTVPADEAPGKAAYLRIDCSMTGNGSSSASLDYTFTIGRSGKIYYEFDSEKNVTLNANKESMASFRVYVLNQGNIPVDYNLTVSSSLLLYTEIIRGEETLGPSESSQAELTVTMPPSEERLVGSIELRTSGSPKKVTWEISIESRVPDLEADDVIKLADPNPILGDRITLLGTVSNKGEVEAETIVCSFYEGTELIGSSTVDYLGPGEQATAPGVEWQPSTTGDREVFFIIDPDDLLFEEEEDNNEASKTFSFFPDISISSVEFEPQVVKKGEDVIARVVVKNTGNADITKGFELKVRNGGGQGDLLATREFDEDVDAGGTDTVQVELIFSAPDTEGKATIWFGVSVIDSEERALDNNKLTGEVEIEGVPAEETNYLLFGIIGVAVAVLVVGVGLYIWKFGLPISPPPGGEKAPGPRDEGPTIEAVPPEPSIEEGEMDEEPLVEMHLEGPPVEEAPVEEPVEEVIVAEVVDDEEAGDIVPPEPMEPSMPEDEDEEGLIPEI
ncbi:MAG: CARDB domain-containing protein [Thermoplasmatota archaeon]